MSFQKDSELDSIYQNVFEFIEKEKLLAGVSNLLLAVSGGPDSLAMLEILKHLSQDFDFTISVAHFDHKLRDDSADDLIFVKDLCVRSDIKFISGEGDVREAMKASGGGVEEIARRLRYDFLAFAAERHSAEAVATGHTFEDQAETVLQRVLRGSGIRGIQGILPESSLPSAPSIRLIRPLLEIGHAETEAVCKVMNLVPRRDVSNETMATQRNRLRSIIFPSLRIENPSVEDALGTLASNARDLFKIVTQMADAVQPVRRIRSQSALYDAKPFEKLPTEAKVLIIEREAIVLQSEIDVNRTRLDNLRNILEKGTGKVVFGAIELEISVGIVRIGKPLSGLVKEKKEYKECIVNLPGITAYNDLEINLSSSVHEDPSSYEKIVGGPFQGALRLRLINASDQMLFHEQYRKINEIFSLLRIPTWDRREMIVLADLEYVYAIIGRDHLIIEKVLGDNPLYLQVKYTN